MAYRDALEYYIAEAGITPAELARRIGSPRSTINQMLRGRVKEPTLGKAKRIAKALGTTLEDMANMAYGDDDA